MPAQESLIGLTFGKLKVIAAGPDYLYGDGKRNAQSLCVCECGNTCVVRNTPLKSGRTRSCGCLIREATIQRNLSHGMSYTRIYRVWKGMRERCEYEKHSHYQSYGARGISVCERWQSFENFLADVGEGKKGWTLERIDNNGNYELSNICWATLVHQARNTRTNTVFSVLGVTGCVAALCEHFNLTQSAAWHRINRGWPIEKVFSVPQNFRLNKIKG